MIAFTVYGAAAAKGSMRGFATKGGPVIITDSNRNVKSWQQLIRTAAADALDSPDLVTGPIACEVVYYLPRPKALQGTKYRSRPVAHTKRPDLDKLTRAVLDALTTVVWADDAQVVDLLAFKRYAAVDGRPRVEIRITPHEHP